MKSPIVCVRHLLFVLIFWGGSEIDVVKHSTLYKPFASAKHSKLKRGTRIFAHSRTSHGHSGNLHMVIPEIFTWPFRKEDRGKREAGNDSSRQFSENEPTRISKQQFETHASKLIQKIHRKNIKQTNVSNNNSKNYQKQDRKQFRTKKHELHPASFFRNPRFLLRISTSWGN